jgi:hypothetical protein
MPRQNETSAEQAPWSGRGMARPVWIPAPLAPRHSGRALDYETMSASRLLRLFVPLVIGATLGVFLADAVEWHKNNGVRTWIEGMPGLGAVLYFPAVPLFYACIFLHLGPIGDAGWVMYPWCIIASWTIIGAGVGLLLLWSSARGRRIVQPGAAPNGGPAGSLGNSSVRGGPPSVS